MIKPDSRLSNIFDGCPDYAVYLEEHPLHLELGVELADYGDLATKREKGLSHAVNPSVLEPFGAELDDLIRLHYLALSRKAMTVLEFGVGKSTLVFDHALGVNKLRHEEYVSANLRCATPFVCHTVDNSAHWLNEVRLKNKTYNVEFYEAAVCMTEYMGAICTAYDPLPNVCPDLIYLDAPDQYSVIGDIRGISTRAADRVPLAADILFMEFFLMPGTLIVVDGRTANARFLAANLKRNWAYIYFKKFDQHFFELREDPLGKYNEMQLDYCLGADRGW